MAANKPIFREPGYEEAKDKRPLAALSGKKSAARDGAAEAAAEAAPEGPNAENLSRAARRAAAKVRDLALSNSFRWFVTLTLDPAKVDRYDVQQVTKKLNTFLDNLVRRHGAAYVLVPELHKDGAIHFHGLVNDCGGFVPSGTWKVPGRGKPKKPRSKAEAAAWAEAGPLEGYHEVFNWNAWPWGFSTALELWGDYEAAVNYVCKYIRKQTTGPGGKIGGRWYYSGGKLNGPKVELLDIVPQELEKSGANVYAFSVPQAGLEIDIARGNSREKENDFTKAGKSNEPGGRGRAGAGGPCGAPEPGTKNT